MIRGNFTRSVVLGFVGVLALTGVKSVKAPLVFETQGDQTFVRPFCGSGAGLNLCSAVLANAKALAVSQVGNHLKLAKEGKLVNPANLAPGAEAFLRDAFMQTPVCLPSESGNDATCGSPCRFVCSADASGKITCEARDAASCQAERAYLRGALHQTVKRMHEETAAGLMAEGKLLLGPKCKSIAKDPANVSLEANFTQAAEEFAAVNGDRPIKCEVKPATEASPTPSQAAASVDEASRNFSSCYLNGARYALETLVAHSLVCESFARASDKWPVVQGYMQGTSKATSEEVIQACKEQGKNSSAAALEACLNETYRSRIRAAYQRRWEEAYVAEPIQVD